MLKTIVLYLLALSFYFENFTFDQLSINFAICFFKYRRELLHPAEICLYYRSSLEVVLHGVAIHIHCRTKEVGIMIFHLISSFEYPFKKFCFDIFAVEHIPF